MSMTAGEFEKFADFGKARLVAGDADVTLDDLVVEWESLQNRDDVNAAIREGLEDARAGRHRPAAEALSDLKKKHNL